MSTKKGKKRKPITNSHAMSHTQKLLPKKKKQNVQIRFRFQE